MQRRRIPRPSPAMFVACLGLAVALGGTSFAAVTSTLVPKGSIGTAQLRNNSVTSVKVRNFSLRAWDFKQGELPRGPKGVQGPVGPQGPPGVIGDLRLYATSVAIPGNLAGNGLYVTKAAEVSCPSGERAITGGTNWSDDSNDRELITVYSRPVITNGKVVGWRARGGTDIATERVFTVQALCAKA
jgi:hypothetical protein